MNGSKTRWIPLTGVAVPILMAIGFWVGGEPPDSTHSPDETVQFYLDNHTKIYIAVGILILAMVFLVYFGSYLRTLLDRGEGESGILSVVAFTGTVVFAVGGAIDGTILIALAEAADDIDASQVQTLQALWDNDFVPLALGIILISLSSGLSIVLHKSLPVWLGWIAILIAIVSFTPVGFFAFPATGLWIVIVGVLQFIREGRTTTPVVE
jgi:hypothetical protein